MEPHCWLDCDKTVIGTDRTVGNQTLEDARNQTLGPVSTEHLGRPQYPSKTIVALKPPEGLSIRRGGKGGREGREGKGEKRKRREEEEGEEEEKEEEYFRLVSCFL